MLRQFCRGEYYFSRLSLQREGLVLTVAIYDSAHTQAVAYLIGQTAAEKIISEYL